MRAALLIALAVALFVGRALKPKAGLHLKGHSR